MRFDTKGRSRLVEVLAEKPELNGNRLASELQTDTEVVYRWLRGDTRPTAHFRLALERLHGIDPALWMTEAESVIAFGPDPKEAA